MKLLQAITILLHYNCLQELRAQDSRFRGKEIEAEFRILDSAFILDFDFGATEAKFSQIDFGLNFYKLFGYCGLHARILSTDAGVYFFCKNLVKKCCKRNLSGAMCASSMQSHLCLKMLSFLLLRAWTMPRKIYLSCGIPFPV